MSAISISGKKEAASGQRKVRVSALPGAAVATVVVWLLAKEVFGMALHQPSFDTRAPQLLTPAFVATIGALAALLGWGTLALLERAGARGARLWLFTAGAVFVLSLAGPFSGHGISTSNRLALVGMHVAAAAVIIPLLYRSSSKRWGS